MKKLNIDQIDNNNFRQLGIEQLAEDLFYKYRETFSRKPNTAKFFKEFLTQNGFDNQEFGGHHISLSQERGILISWYSENDYSYSQIYAQSHEKIIKLFELIKDFVDFISLRDRYLSYFYKGEHGMQCAEINVEIFDNIIPDLYPDIHIDKLCEEFCNSNEKILLLYGLPGTGKTTFIKYLIKTKLFESMAYVKDKEVYNTGTFWVKLLESKYDLLIFDDLDFALKARSEEQNDFMGNILSFSDGALTNNTRIIITTNQKITEIDSALVRPGRCFDFLILNSLDRVYAKDLWTNKLNNSIENFNKIFGNKKFITQAELISEHQRLSRGSLKRSYVKDVSNNQYSIESKIERLGIQIKNRDNQLGFGE